MTSHVFHLWYLASESVQDGLRKGPRHPRQRPPVATRAHASLQALLLSLQDLVLIRTQTCRLPAWEMLSTP